MSSQYISPEEIIKSLEQSFDNLTFSEDGKGSKGVTFRNAKLRCVSDGISRALLVNVNIPMQILRGVVNPDDKSDVRNAYANENAGKVLKAAFELRSEVLLRALSLLSDAFIANVRKMQLAGTVSKNKIISPVIDLGRSLQQKPNKDLTEAQADANKDKLRENPYAFQDGFKYECPRFEAKISFERYSEKHPNLNLRNKIKSEIFDGNMPVMAAGRIAGYQPPMIDRQPFSYGNAYKFINDGATFLRSRLDFSAAVVTDSMVTFPCLINYAIVTTGVAASPHDGIDLTGLPMPAAAAPVALEEKLQDKPQEKQNGEEKSENLEF